MKEHDITPSKKLHSIKPYFFVDRGKKIAELKSNGKDIIRLDMGAPDLPPSDAIIDTLIEKVKKDDTHSYTPSGGGNDFRVAISNYYKSRFDVDIDPFSEALGLIGSKEGLFNMGQALLDADDVSLIPEPSYPVYTSTSIIAGAEIINIPLIEENDFLPDFCVIPIDKLKKSKILWLNYPSNPTGATADLKFYQQIIDYFTNFNIVIINDAAYSEVYFEHKSVPSILQIPGAKDFCVEVNSLSKSFNMAGWRLGMAVGSKKAINILSTYKSQVDSSTFSPILSAGCKALEYDKNWVDERNNIYRTRRDLIYNSLINMGFSTRLPSAGMYIWAKQPNLFMNSMDFSNNMLNEIGVSTTPGIIFGKHGEGFLRFSIGMANHRIEEAMQRLSNWINK